MITIKKAASLTGLSVKAIRLYESRGLLPKPERTDAGYRMYSESDIARLQQIRYFREMKFPLTEIAALLDASTEEVQKAMIRQQAEVDRILEEYKRAQMLLQSLLPEDIDAAALSSAPDVCRPAIVAIDLQNDILEGGALACGRIHLILPQLKKLFARARQMGVPVIYVCDRHYKNDPELQLWNNHMMAGSYGVQIPGQYDDEIGELVSTINDMSVKIGQAEKTQTEFISSVSHELRTPLTAISGWGETLLTSENLDAETRRGVVIIAREAKRLTGMVEELLEFTRMQDGRFTLHVETADILAEFEDTVFMYGNRLKQEGICLHYDGCDEEIPEIPCDVARMRQVFLNILDNAAKHGGEGKRIDASIAHEGSFVVIRMRDYGPGIPEEELPHVKLKFYKGSSKARGSGIGLAVCEEIVTMHGGTLTLENAEGGGTLVTISIPTGEE